MVGSSKLKGTGSLKLFTFKKDRGGRSSIKLLARHDGCVMGDAAENASGIDNGLKCDVMHHGISWELRVPHAQRRAYEKEN